MAIKKVSFSFDIPLTTLLGLIASGNADMRVDVFADNRPAKTPRIGKSADPLLIEGPKKKGMGRPPTTGVRGKDANGNAATAYNTLLKHFASNPKRTVTPKELYPLLEGIGLKKNSVSPQVSLLKKRGMIEMPSMGLYTVLREGIVEAKKRGLLAPKGANGVDAHG